MLKNKQRVTLKKQRWSSFPEPAQSRKSRAAQHWEQTQAVKQRSEVAGSRRSAPHRAPEHQHSQTEPESADTGSPSSLKVIFHMPLFHLLYGSIHFHQYKEYTANRVINLCYQVVMTFILSSPENIFKIQFQNSNWI